MPSTTDNGISLTNLFGKESSTGKLARIVGNNKKGIAINAKKITVLKNISQSQSKRISGDTVGDKLPGGGSLKSILGSIASSMDGIRDTLIAQNKVESKAADDERKAAEKAARGKQEKELEGKFQGIRSVADKVLAPIKSIWETIVNFITTVFLGKLALKLFDWFANKENQDKVKAIGRFFKDWWPVLLAGYLLFGNALTAFVGGLIGKLVIWGGVLIAKVIPALVKALARMKLGALGKAGLVVGGVVAAGYGVSKLMGGGERKNSQCRMAVLFRDLLINKEEFLLRLKVVSLL